MTTELATQTNGSRLATMHEPVDPAILELVVCNGDLSKLSAGQRVSWYRSRCEAAGLDPRTQPFQYLSLQGKLTLYATKAATDQLIGTHKLTVEILDRTHLADLGIYEVRCRVMFPDGRHVEDVAALSIAGLKADALANALMKVVTKAKRRTVLSACGLGMLDETEVDTIAGAERVQDDRTAHHAVNHDNQTGHGSGAYAAPAVVKSYKEWVEEFVAGVNSKWLDKWTGPDGEVKEGIKTELIRTYGVTGHLVKWGVAQGLIKAPVGGGKLGQRDKFAGVLYERWRDEAMAEAAVYARKEWAKARDEHEAAATPPPEEEVSQEVPDDDAGDPDGPYPDDFPAKAGREPGEDD